MSQVEEDLAAFLDGDGEELFAEIEADAPPVPIPSLEEASRYLRRLRREQENAAETNRVVDAEVQRLEEFRSDRLAASERAIGWLTRSLEGFMRQYHEATNKKTATTPHGRLTLAKQSERMIVVDEEALVAFAHEHGLVGPADEDEEPDSLRFVRTSEKVSKTILDRMRRYAITDVGQTRVTALAFITEEGEILRVPGAAVAERTPMRFNIAGVTMPKPGDEDLINAVEVFLEELDRVEQEQKQDQPKQGDEQ